MARRSPTTRQSPLSADEADAWRAFVIGVHLLFDQLDRDLQRQAGLTHAYYSILFMLSDMPGRAVRMSKLATALCFSPSRISESMLRLEKRGWVRREPSADDRRGSVAVLTDAGFVALNAATPPHLQSVRRYLLDHLTHEQVSQLRDISRAFAGPLLASMGFPAEHAEQPIGARKVRPIRRTASRSTTPPPAPS
ncbi:MAG: MarR family winged helix-turn-helix transcriptional regulator [Chloroflexota bacterium]